MLVFLPAHVLGPRPTLRRRSNYSPLCSHKECGRRRRDGRRGAAGLVWAKLWARLPHLPRLCHGRQCKKQQQQNSVAVSGGGERGGSWRGLRRHTVWRDTLPSSPLSPPFLVHSLPPTPFPSLSPPRLTLCSPLPTSTAASLRGTHLLRLAAEIALADENDALQLNKTILRGK